VIAPAGARRGKEHQMPPDDAQFLRLAIDLARQARAGGADPFGAALVRDGVVVHQVADRCVALSDPTFHAELSAISEYCRAARQFSLSGVTLYSSAEPCPMCAGAIHWARISRVVFSVSQAMLQERSGGRPKPACAAILQALGSGAEVVGPLLAEEGLAVFDGYAFVPKATRHAARFKEPAA
jgi:tRNA(Arg) A34 adenosine deaminase TadA